MVLFRLLWLKRLIRRNTKPIAPVTAETWKRRLAVAYAIFAWNAFGVVVFLICTGKGDWAKYFGLKSNNELELTPAQQWTKTLGIRKATVYNIDGFNVKRYEILNEELEDRSPKIFKFQKKNETQKKDTQTETNTESQ